MFIKFNIRTNPNIRNNFFNRINKQLDKCIIIVDEGHNLGNRIRELLTVKLTNNMIKNAIKEAKQYKYKEKIEN